jgi:serine/threonine-protein kinase
MAKIFTITEGLENMGALRSGGQGSVYKGRRIGPIITAVKLLPTPIHAENEDDKNYRNFKNEVEKLKKVNQEPNPNVVKILDYGITESGSLPFIEMEYIEGPDLEELVRPPHDALFTIKEVIKVAEQLACALMHCHKAGVRHGDIKSNNVKFNYQTGNYILLDFGLAVMSDEQRRTSLRNAGAIEFMAPEQNEGVMLFQTDIYSYGVILYELLAGVVPFPLNSQSETARNQVRMAHLETPVPDLLTNRREHLPDGWPEEKKEREMQVPDWLLELVYKCLQKDPENRYADGMELQESLAYHHTSVNSYALAAENDRLKLLLAKNQVADPLESVPLEERNGYQNNSLMQISKGVFFGLMLLLIGSLAFCGYLLFSSGTNARIVTKTVTDTIVKQDTTALANYLKAHRRNRLKPKDSTGIEVAPANDNTPMTHRADSSAKQESDTSKNKTDGQ